MNNPSVDDFICKEAMTYIDKGQNNSNKNAIAIRFHQNGKILYDYCYPWSVEEIKNDEKYR